MIPYHQMTLADVFTETQEIFETDKPEFLKYITNPSVAPNGLKMIFRSDCMANLLLWYLMGATEGMREEPINMGEIKNMLANWKERIADTGSFIMPYAEAFNEVAKVSPIIGGDTETDWAASQIDSIYQELKK